MYEHFLMLLLMAHIQSPLVGTGATCNQRMLKLDGSTGAQQGGSEGGEPELANFRQTDLVGGDLNNDTYHVKDSNFTRASQQEIELLRLEYNKYQILTRLGMTRDPDYNLIDENMRRGLISSMSKARNRSVTIVNSANNNTTIKFDTDIRDGNIVGNVGIYT